MTIKFTLIIINFHLKNINNFKPCYLFNPIYILQKHGAVTDTRLYFWFFSMERGIADEITFTSLNNEEEFDDLRSIVFD